MEKILSQEEVNALLRGVSTGEVETKAKEADKSGIRPYDLTNQDRIIRGRMPSLETINERFSRFFQASLTASLKKTVTFSPSAPEVMKFGEFLKKLPLPSNINLIRMEPLRGYSIFAMDTRLVYLLVDLFFGGTGTLHVKPEGRDFTAIEMRIIRKVVDMALSDLERSYRPVHQVNIQYSRSEINPQFATIVAPTEIVISINFKLEIDTEIRDIYLCLPYSTIEPIKDKLYAGFQSDQLDAGQSWIPALKNLLCGCRVPVEAELGMANVRIEDLFNLKVGDILLLEKGISEPLIAKIYGVPKFKGHPGIYKGNQAFQISSLIKGETDGSHF